MPRRLGLGDLLHDPLGFLRRFHPHSFVPTFGALGLAVITDVDSDAHPDIVIAEDRLDGGSHVFWGPSYALDEATRLPSREVSSVVAVDLNLDEHTDRVFARTITLGASITSSYVFNNSREATELGTPTLLPTLGAYGVDIGDLDLDGFPDIVFANRGGTATREVDSDTREVRPGAGWLRAPGPVPTCRTPRCTACRSSRPT